MARHPVLLVLAGAIACGGSSAQEDPLALEGGTLRLDPCGVDVVTRVGASSPQPGGLHVGTDPTPHGVHLGLAGDPSTTMAISWRTRDEDTRATTVEYGVASLDQRSEGATFVYRAGFGESSPLVRVHEVHLCGLTPDTEYQYRVGGAGTFSETATFRTAPLPSTDDEVVIALLGDTRNGYDVWGSALAKLEEVATPDLILFSGDAVSLGQLQPDWDAFFAAAEPTLRRVPMVATIGNHETNSTTYFSLLALPGDEQDFGFDYGAAHLTVIDDNGADPAAPAQFLASDLAAASSRPWRLVMHHRAIYSAAANHGGSETLRAAFEPIYDAHDVALVLNGHDHVYERTHEMRAGAPSAEGGVTYVVSGGAGASLYEAGLGAWTAIAEKRHHFVVMRIRPERLELRAYDLDGTMFDELTLTR
jgi:Purple acid Phosphatase, N-terminal domain/Calcineurin-like phosphoesterase